MTPRSLFAAETLIHDAIEACRLKFDENCIDLVLELPSKPIVLNADATRLVQVFASLLNNAAKFTERGGRVTLSAECQEREVAVRLCDTGIGIPADVLQESLRCLSKATAR